MNVIKYFFVFVSIFCFSSFWGCGESQSTSRNVSDTSSTTSPEASASTKETGTTAQAGDRTVATINGIEYPFRWCPPGRFTMGSPSSEEGHGDDEHQHTVILSKGFWLLETPVTEEMWKSVMKDSSGSNNGAKYPVEDVSWLDCQKFLQKLNESAPAGRRYVLPTESQWEYACRAGTTGAYGGTGNIDEMGWYGYKKDLDSGIPGNSGGKSHPVGTKKPNAWGLFDMHGNVDEWCSDIYGDYPRKMVTDPTGVASGNATGSASGDRRVCRGGAYGYPCLGCRSAYRCSFEEGEKLAGLRIAVISEK
ncbi:MAG: formylglycine-generating enzyme family protein [Thermoguttaceae bacterium]|nr:formylglycine-generating enzyme family protein [Thermoguttaceae bacterium]